MYSFAPGLLSEHPGAAAIAITISDVLMMTGPVEEAVVGIVPLVM